MTNSYDAYATIVVCSAGAVNLCETRAKWY
jgi:hypothetical protein